MAKKTKDPLAPLDFLTSMFATLIVVILLCVPASAIFGWGLTFFDIGGDSVCVVTDLSQFGLAESPDQGVRPSRGVSDQITINPDGTRLCDTAPGLREQITVSLIQLPSFLVFAGFVLLTRRIIRSAGTGGLFSFDLARRIVAMGRFLLVGLVAAAALKWLGEGLLLSGMVDSMTWTSGSVSLSFPALIGAVGMVCVGRVMLHAADLQNDVDGTV